MPCDKHTKVYFVKYQQIKMLTICKRVYLMYALCLIVPFFIILITFKNSCYEKVFLIYFIFHW